MITRARSRPRLRGQIAAPIPEPPTRTHTLRLSSLRPSARARTGHSRCRTLATPGHTKWSLEKSVVPSTVSRNERGEGCRPPGAEAEQAMRSRGQTNQRACQQEAKDVARRRRRRALPTGGEKRTALEARDQRRFRPDVAAGRSDTASATARRRSAPAIARHSLRNAFLVLFAAMLATPRINNPSSSTARLRGGRGSAVLARGVPLGMGVMAAPCAVAGGLGAEEVTVTPESDGGELLSLFDCEGGEFNVSWLGEAGDVPLPGDEDVDGAGGAIGTEFTDVLVDGCLFEKCFASKKGGGMHQWMGQISVLDSVFYNNTAGSANREDDDEIGEGGAISFTTCNTSFDGLAACGANDTVFFKNDVGRKGGAIVIGSDGDSTYIELHRCTVEKSETGREIEDDPQGDGGAVAVAWGITLLVADSLLTDNYCGKKGGVVTLSSGEGFPGDDVDEPGPVVILRNSTFTDNS
ncbi:hypothetical protein Esi_0040_0008 [Ectocarpus siliculosus]|uniref:Uncharacterized protein n=1 Tax=Ectocarpus siliculosus TaxID=2880 RepID=D7G0A9_ECTSI|nr:hypothetical protein Esi_0040_0008 [Ectocarpus siliculosus]|eukprot:CBJ26636.1 hypothetical protein Esi_0040_0008 [Ectocarpus siliculosus]